jgi:hypothetical protein
MVLKHYWRKMATRKRSAGKSASSVNGSDAVNEFMDKLEHPLKSEMEAVRTVILSANKEITEGLKWNAPSFYFNGYFATFNPRARDFVQVIFHQGAKAKDNGPEGLKIDDDGGLLEWLAKDRCSAKFYNMEDIASRKAALRSVVNQWIRFMDK